MYVVDMVLPVWNLNVNLIDSFVEILSLILRRLCYILLCPLENMFIVVSLCIVYVGHISFQYIRVIHLPTVSQDFLNGIGVVMK